jgi:hypothetical protein
MIDTRLPGMMSNPYIEKNENGTTTKGLPRHHRCGSLFHYHNIIVKQTKQICSGASGVMLNNSLTLQHDKTINRTTKHYIYPRILQLLLKAYVQSFSTLRFSTLRCNEALASAC